MLMHNPYQPPEILDDHVEPTRRKDAPLIWFAATLTGALYIPVTYFYALRYAELAELDAAFELLELTGALAIPGIVIYAAMRHVFRGRFDYQSTWLSLLLMGLLGALYLTLYLNLVKHFRWTRFGGRHVVGLLATAIAIPFAFCAVGLERWFTRFVPMGRQTDDGQMVSVRKSSSHASILWYSAAIYIVGFAFGVAGSSPPRLSRIHEISSMLAIVATIPYGLTSLCFRRNYPALIASRLSAALGFIGAMFAVAFAYSIFVTGGMSSIIALVNLGLSGVCAAVVDRLVSRFSATGDPRSRSPSVDEKADA